jgi:hypothetical protein
VSTTDAYTKYTIFNSTSIYIYKRLRPRKKIRNRKKKEQQKLFINEIEHLLNLNAGWLTGEWGAGGAGWLADPCKAWVPPPSIK